MALATLEPARRVVDRPLIGRARLDLLPGRYRIWPVKGFPYVLVYDSTHAPARIARLLHTARNFPPLLVGLADLGEGPA